MQYLPRCHHIALAIAAYVGLTAAALADTTPFDRQERGGLVLNVPFDSHGFVFKDATLNLVFQSVKVKSSAQGWQLSFGSKLHAFSPVFAVSALGGDRCGQATVGVSYGGGQWGLPVGLQGSYVQVGLRNEGQFGGFQAGLNTLGCFKRYAPPTAAPAPPPQAPAPAPSSGSQQSASLGTAWLRSPATAADFDWS